MEKRETNVYLLSDLGAGDTISGSLQSFRSFVSFHLEGPAMIIDPAYFITIVLHPDCSATVTDLGHVSIQVPSPTSTVAVPGQSKVGSEDNVVERSLFIHRFMKYFFHSSVS